MFIDIKILLVRRSSTAVSSETNLDENLASF